ncbi:forkhead box protein B2 X1 [Biomphalaria glabrata]|nr:forkhead box protein B2 X1 [Biomphalaria glabrata]
MLRFKEFRTPKRSTNGIHSLLKCSVIVSSQLHWTASVCGVYRVPLFKTIKSISETEKIIIVIDLMI